MKNRKIGKMMAGIGLACVSGLSLAGCADLELDQSKIDKLIEQGETYLETQNGIDYATLAEELSKYINSDSLVDKDALAEALEQYRQDNLSAEQIKIKLLSDFSILYKSTLGHNYTLNTTDQGIQRVEFDNSITKIYYYKPGDNSEKKHEVYIEIIKDQGVKTYIKDVNLYSFVPFSKFQDKNVMNFTTMYLACKSSVGDGEYETWGSVLNSLGYNYDSDINDGNEYYGGLGALFEFIDDYINISMDEFINQCPSFTTDDDMNIYSLDFGELGRDEYCHESWNHVFGENYYKVSCVYSDYDTNTSFSEKTSYVYEYIFDEENQSTINFDKTGFQSVEEYYNSLES